MKRMVKYMQYRPNFDDELDLDHVEEIKAQVHRQHGAESLRSPLRSASMRELEDLIKQLRPRKAPSPDNIGFSPNHGSDRLKSYTDQTSRRGRRADSHT